MRPLHVLHKRLGALANVTHGKKPRESGTKALRHGTTLISAFTNNLTARETRSLNVAVAALMELSNFLRSHQNSKGDSVQMLDSIRMLLVMLYPIAPHMASELWSGLQPLPSTFGKANVREIVGPFTFALKAQFKSKRIADNAVPTSYPYTFDN